MERVTVNHGYSARTNSSRATTKTRHILSESWLSPQGLETDFPLLQCELRFNRCPLTIRLILTFESYLWTSGHVLLCLNWSKKKVPLVFQSSCLHSIQLQHWWHKFCSAIINCGVQMTNFYSCQMIKQLYSASKQKSKLSRSDWSRIHYTVAQCWLWVWIVNRPF